MKAVADAPHSAAAGPGDVHVLLQAFQQFEENTRRLESAYRKMQEDFHRLNLELDAKNNLLSLILQSLTNAVVAVDNEGRITSFNQGAERLFGVPGAEAVGKPYADLPGREIPETQSLLYTLSTGRHVTEQEKRVRNAEGLAVPVSYTTCILEDGHGGRLGALEVLRDLSEVKAMQEEVERSKTLAALGEMSAAVAHEIRNPLGAIGGFLTLLERDLEHEPAKLDLVRQIVKSLTSLNKVVSNLLLYTKPLALQPREVDLCDLSRQVLDFIALDLAAGTVEMVRDFPDQPVRCSLDPEKIEQVLLNLVRNAVQAVTPPGRVTVAIRERRAEPGGRLFLSGLRVDRTVELEVADTGRGIPPDDLNRIFNPFFTTKVDGNGLGLSIVKKILDLHDAEIRVDSTMGRGARFTLEFPG